MASSDDRDRVIEGLGPDVVLALGKLSEALETTERARGALFDFHQLTGHADFMLDEAIELLVDAGHTELAEEIRTELVGRNVVAGMWTFEIVEDYDDNYMTPFRGLERAIRLELAGGWRHLHEARLKRERGGR
jgi:hypothetical protein